MYSSVHMVRLRLKYPTPFVYGLAFAHKSHNSSMLSYDIAMLVNVQRYLLHLQVEAVRCPGKKEALLVQLTAERLVFPSAFTRDPVKAEERN